MPARPPRLLARGNGSFMRTELVTHRPQLVESPVDVTPDVG
jgi:hypothetical protein